MAAILLGLGCSLSWGLADFLAGVASRRTHAAWAAVLSQGTGLVSLLVIAGITGDDPPAATSDTLAGLAAGAAGGLGLVALYRGLAIGTMSVVAPVSALGVAVPVTAGLVGGERPSSPALVGIALGVGGVALATRARGPASSRGVGLAILAAIGFGAFFALLAEAAEEDALWAAASARLASVPLIAVAALAARAPLSVGGGDLVRIAFAGLLDGAAATAFGLAAQRWPLSLVAVLASLYPATTVVLAHLRLGERLSAMQLCGVGGVLAGVALIVAG